MAHTDNYQLQFQSAQKRFLTYDQEKLIKKFRLRHDADYLYPTLLGSNYRLCRRTGSLERQQEAQWVDANSFGEVMTLLDMLCDSRDDRCLSGRWKQMQHFGLMFHQNLLEDKHHPLAAAFDRDEAALRQACAALGAQPFPGGDFGCTIPLFDGLSIGMLFWHGDDEFLPRLRYIWDENALQYIRYETMYFAVGLLESRLLALL